MRRLLNQSSTGPELSEDWRLFRIICSIASAGIIKSISDIPVISIVSVASIVLLSDAWICH